MPNGSFKEQQEEHLQDIHEERTSFLSLADKRFSDPIIYLCDIGQGILEELGNLIQRGREKGLERDRAISLLISLGNTIDELRNRKGQLAQLGLGTLADLAEECAEFLDREFGVGRELIGIPADEVEEIRLRMRDSEAGISPR